MARIDAETAGGSNVLAFLDTIGLSELGAGLITPDTDDGYQVIVGSTPENPDLFTDYSDHPRKLVPLGNLGIKSTAAGKYQILAHIYDVYKVQLKLPDFSPVSQDLIALQMIKECHAIQSLQNGDINTALTSCSSRWASLPAATYGQHTNSIAALTADYESAGGTVS